jgi:phosphatidylinositol 4-kinase
MIDVLGGQDSGKFDDFRKRMSKGFHALQENAEKIIILVEMMLNGQSDLPCFIGGRTLVRELKDRLFPNQRRMNQVECQRHVDGLIAESLNNWRTRCYDNF